MKRHKRDNLGQTFYIATKKAPCRNTPGFANLAVEAAHQNRGVYNACIRILIDADDENMPLRSGYGYEGPSLLEALLNLRKTTPWLKDVSSNIRRSAAAQAHTAFGLWTEAQRMNAWRLANASDLRLKRRELLERTTVLRRTKPTVYRRRREKTLESVQKMRRTARRFTAKAERYARRDRNPEHMMRRHKDACQRDRLTFPLTADKVRFLDDTRQRIRVWGFGDIELKQPLPTGIKPVSLTLVARLKRRHRKKRSPVRLKQLEWSAHVQYRRYGEQKPVTANCSSIGVDPGVKHVATTQDDQGQIAHYHYTGTQIIQYERRLQNLRHRRSDCTRRSRRSKRYNREIRRVSKRLTNLRNHQTVEMAKAIVGENAVVGIEDFQADNSRRSAKGTNETPGTNVEAKKGLSRALAYARPGELKQQLKRESERCGAVWNMNPAQNTSLRCSRCGHTAKKNRENQAQFRCLVCDHTANADANAAENHRQGAISWLLAKLARPPTAPRKGAASTAPCDRRKPVAKASPRYIGRPDKAIDTPPKTMTRRNNQNRLPTQVVT